MTREQNRKVKENLIKWLSVRLTADEFERIDQSFKKTTFRKMSEYIRAVLFHRKITVYVRDESTNELTVTIALLRKELNQLGEQFNTVAKRINSVKDSGELSNGVRFGFDLQDKILNKVEEIKGYLNQSAGRVCSSIK